MELISVEQRNELILSARTRLKLELRDRYAVDEATLDAWRRGDIEAVQARMKPIADRIAAQVADGVSVRRIKVVSEPPSEYMRLVLETSGTLVEAGEDIRWLPRRLTSALLLPGNDLFVLDSKIVVFNVLDGDDGRAEQQLYTDPEIVERCRETFEAVWPLAIPHRAYRPT
jgi:hypothetical protein